MYNKVEICGVNTSKLTVISEEKKRELLKKTRGGDKAARLGLRVREGAAFIFICRGRAADENGDGGRGKHKRG